MLRPRSQIIFEQQPTTDFKTRTGTVVYNFCNEVECSNSWKNLTDKGHVTLPKNVFVKDKNGKMFSLGGQNINIGGFASASQVPIFLRGDKVTINWGYLFYDQSGNEKTNFPTQIYQGFISSISIEQTFTIELEDNMYLLKRVTATGGNNGFFSGKKYTVESMLQEMITNAGLTQLTVNTSTQTSLGDFTTRNESICEVLAQLKKLYHFEAYFRGTELRAGSFVYIPSDAGTGNYSKFYFEKNIISNSLEYRRKDDLTLSAVASNQILEDTGKMTKDGQAKTKKIKLEVLVTFQNGSNTPTYIIPTKLLPIPPNTGGERREFKFPGTTSVEELETLATNQLRKYYYTGFKGKFTTFGMPYVRMGDNVDVISIVLPERNGRYKVRSVTYKIGLDGLRQEIELDYLIQRLDANGKTI